MCTPLGRAGQECHPGSHKVLLTANETGPGLEALFVLFYFIYFKFKPLYIHGRHYYEPIIQMLTPRPREAQ